MKKLELRHRETFLNNYLHPAIEMNLVSMTDPESPTSPKQKYVITEKGLSLKTTGK
jgi:ATP-dependent DNA helicase RecG